MALKQLAKQEILWASQVYKFCPKNSKKSGQNQEYLYISWTEIIFDVCLKYGLKPPDKK